MKVGIFCAVALALALIVSPAGAGSANGLRAAHVTKAFWQRSTLTVRGTRQARPALRLRGEVRAFTLRSSALRSVLAHAPRVISLPAPDGSFQRFRLTPSAIMAPGLARRHPDIKTYAGRGIDDPAATIHADLSRIGFHASVRSPHGGWYIDPYYRNSQQRYVSYFTTQVLNTHGPFVEREVEGRSPMRALRPGSTGDQLRTYRLALLTDPGYATYFGGSANVTAAKVALINRVSQVYEDETSIRLQLIANDDLLNLDTDAQMTGANGPCGGSACYTSGQATSCTGSTLTRTRQVIGLLVGASSFDIGHIALGQPGGGVAQLAVVGGNNKAEGCTGLTTPTGDFFAVDYVAHEMGHQFAGNHTFNGTQSNCSGGNRNPGTSVEPGSGSSVMAYAGICGSDDLQRHSDPYWSERSFDEITTYVSSTETNISEVQMGVLTGFSTNGQQFQLRYNGNDSAPVVRGTNFTAGGIEAAIEGISGWPAGGTATVSAVSDTAFTVTFGGTLANTDVAQLQLVNCSSCTGYVGEIAKGGQTTRHGTVTATGNAIPTVTAPAQYTIPLRTPFALTASGSDADGDTLTYLWEQNDRGGNGTGLVDNNKVDGPLFRQFGLAAQVSDEDSLLYNSPGENAASTDPTRVFPDLQQILDNNTNAETGTCPPAEDPPTQAEVDCFSEYLPNASYIGLAGVNQSPLSLHFRVTVRDGHGGVNSNAPTQTTLLLANNSGPFLVTAPNTATTWYAGTTEAVTWDPANTDGAPVNASDVAISLSTDGGLTYPTVLAASTPNDGSESITVPAIDTSQARVKIEALGNVFFDVSDADFTITTAPPPPPPPPLPPPPPPPPPPSPPPPRCVVPKVTGLTLSRAKAKIRRAHCRTGTVSRKFSSRRLKNHVIKQRPKQGTHLANGGRVNLTVGKGPRK